MRNVIWIIVFGLLGANAFGVGLAVGGFYMLSVPVGVLGDAYDRSVYGAGGKVVLDLLLGLSADVAVGYNASYAAIWTGSGPAPGNWSDYSLATVPMTYGGSFKLNLGFIKPYVGAGGAFVAEKTNTPAGYGATSIKKHGFYAGGGFTYAFTDKVALDANPRYLFVLDKDAGIAPSKNSTFVDVLVGIDYSLL